HTFLYRKRINCFFYLTFFIFSSRMMCIVLHLISYSNEPFDTLLLRCSSTPSSSQPKSGRLFTLATSSLLDKCLNFSLQSLSTSVPSHGEGGRSSAKSNSSVQNSSL